MLRTFTLTDFKSYQQATLHLAPLTLLVGANASGKSNAIEAFQVLSWLARGRRLDEIFRSVGEPDLTIRGTIPDLGYSKADRFTLGCELELDAEQLSLQVEIWIDSKGMRIASEKLISTQEALPLYEGKQTYPSSSNSILVNYNNFARGKNKPSILCTDQQAIFTQLLTPARFEAKHDLSQQRIPGAAQRLIEHLQRVLFLDPVPRRMRGYSFVVDRALRHDGANLSSTLFDLCGTEAGKSRILEFIRNLPEQDISKIDFLEGPRKEVMLRLEESFGGKSTFRDASVLSDGTLRILAVGAALLSSEPGSTVVVEEIDNGVHPSRAKQLLESIESIAQQRRLSVLVTSHNPALLDALPVKSIPHVVFCYRDPTKGDSRLVRLEDLPRLPELVAQGPLGQLVSRGVLDRFVKNPTTPEQRTLALDQWLESVSDPVPAA